MANAKSKKRTPFIERLRVPDKDTLSNVEEILDAIEEGKVEEARALLESLSDMQEMNLVEIEKSIELLENAQKNIIERTLESGQLSL